MTWLATTNQSALFQSVIVNSTTKSFYETCSRCLIIGTQVCLLPYYIRTKCSNTFLFQIGGGEFYSIGSAAAAKKLCHWVAKNRLNITILRLLELVPSADPLISQQQNIENCNPTPLITVISLCNVEALFSIKAMSLIDGKKSEKLFFTFIAH